MTKDEALNIAAQCRATASHSLACKITVDGGSGLLTELLLDAARVIEALAQPVQEPEPDELTIVYMSGLYDGKKKRPWVGLTDAQFLEAARLAEDGNYLVAFQRIQQWLKEKNT